MVATLSRFGSCAWPVRKIMLATHSDSHVSECEQPGEKYVRLDALSHQTPIRKRLFRLLQQIENFPSRESTRGVVVRFVSGLLQVDESRRDSNPFRLDSLTVQTRGELRGHVVIRELLSHLLHAAYGNPISRFGGGYGMEVVGVYVRTYSIRLGIPGSHAGVAWGRHT